MQKIAHLEALVTKQTSPAPSAPSAPSAPASPAEPSRMEALLEKTLSRLEKLEGKMSEQPSTAVAPAEKPKAVSPETAKPSEKAKAAKATPAPPEDEWVTTPTGQKVTLIDIHMYI